MLPLALSLLLSQESISAWFFGSCIKSGLDLISVVGFPLESVTGTSTSM